MDELPADWSEFRGNSGIFLECRIDTDEEIKLIDSEKLQTLLVLGIDQEELQKMIEKQRMPNHEQLMGIIDKYRPEYAAVPEKYMMHLGKNYEEKWRSKGYIYYARKTEEESCKLHKDLALLLSTSGSISYLSDKLHLFYKNFSVRKIKKIPRNTSGKVLYEQLEEQ